MARPRAGRPRWPKGSERKPRAPPLTWCDQNRRDEVPNAKGRSSLCIKFGRNQRGSLWVCLITSAVCQATPDRETGVPRWEWRTKNHKDSQKRPPKRRPEVMHYSSRVPISPLTQPQPAVFAMETALPPSSASPSRPRFSNAPWEMQSIFACLSAAGAHSAFSIGPQVPEDCAKIPAVSGGCGL